MDAWNTIVSSWVPAYFQVQALSFREGTQSKQDSFPWLAHEMQEQDPELEKISLAVKKAASRTPGWLIQWPKIGIHQHTALWPAKKDQIWGKVLD